MSATGARTASRGSRPRRAERARRRSASGRGGGGARQGHDRHLPVGARAAAGRGAAGEGRQRRGGRVLARGDRAGGAGGDQADAGRCRRSSSSINALFGTLIAWVLVRDEFPGKRIVNALIDLPFALPTIVAGVVLLALYGNNSPLGIDVAFTRASIALALLFVTLPFVVRSVQPVLLELDRSMEEAAASLGAGPVTVLRRIVLPTLTPGDRLGGRAELRAGGRRVRLARADHGQPAVQDRGRLGVRVRPDPGRKPAGRGGRVGRAAARRADRAGRADAASRAGGRSMSASATAHRARLGARPASATTCAPRRARTRAARGGCSCAASRSAISRCCCWRRWR